MCRLLSIDDEQARSWVEEVAAEAMAVRGRSFHSLPLPEKILILTQASRRLLYGPPEETFESPGALQPFQDLVPDVVWTSKVGDDRRFAVVGAASKGLAWLVDLETGSPPELLPVEYDESYFQGGKTTVGYGDYESQRWWREEKAERQLRQVQALSAYLGSGFGKRPRALDVGAGFGFFRKALESDGWTHEGVELSEFANDVSQRWFGFCAHRGSLTDYAKTEPGEFDLITMWDVVEHVPDPNALLAAAEPLLKPRGLLCIRTPNIEALEREVFGPAYHSFKLEHLVYFSPRSLVTAFETAGLSVGLITTHSHLLRGYLGKSTRGIAALLRGSDILAVAQRVRK